MFWLRKNLSKLGYLFLILGCLVITVEFVKNRNDFYSEQNKIELTIQSEIGYVKKDNIDTYDMVLVIPKINLKKGIYDKEDTRNNIEENVTIHLESDYPDLESSNLILMAHSGTGKKAFFQRVLELDNNSLVEIYYNNFKYVYKIDNFYTVNKTGSLPIKRDTTKKTITLITCSQDDKTKQVVYIGYLIDEISYIY